MLNGFYFHVPGQTWKKSRRYLKESPVICCSCPNIVQIREHWSPELHEMSFSEEAGRNVCLVISWCELGLKLSTAQFRGGRGWGESPSFDSMYQAANSVSPSCTSVISLFFFFNLISNHLHLDFYRKERSILPLLVEEQFCEHLCVLYGKWCGESLETCWLESADMWLTAWFCMRLVCWLTLHCGSRVNSGQMQSEWCTPPRAGPRLLPCRRWAALCRQTESRRCKQETCHLHICGFTSNLSLAYQTSSSSSSIFLQIFLEASQVLLPVFGLFKWAFKSCFRYFLNQLKRASHARSFPCLKF